MRILITGVQGMVGTDLARIAKERGHEVIAASRKDLDITHREEVLARIGEWKPDCIINTAAYNLVDAAEAPEGKALAQAINTDGPTNLAEAAHAAGIPLVHMSTDYVFAGTNPDGYREDDIAEPIEGVYAQTKYAGEIGVQRIHNKAYIVRTTKIFGEKGDSPNVKESFVTMMLRFAKEKPELNIVNEQFGCPTYSPDVANAMLDLVEGKYPYGIYHLVNAGKPVTPYEWAQEIFTCAGIHPKVNEVPASFFPTNAQRPAYAALLNTKFPALRERGEALREFLSRLHV